jgi:hypothetical protein
MKKVFKYLLLVILLFILFCENHDRQKKNNEDILNCFIVSRLITDRDQKSLFQLTCTVKVTDDNLNN